MVQKLKDCRLIITAGMYDPELGLGNEDEWEKFCQTRKNPDDIPSSPQVIFQVQGWSGFGNWQCKVSL